MFGILGSDSAWCAPGAHAGSVPGSTPEPLPLAFMRTMRHAVRVEEEAILAEHAMLRSLCLLKTRLSRDQIIPENHLLFDVLREKPRGPGFLEVLPTDACNHACGWCFTSRTRSANWIEPGRLRTELEQFKKDGGASVLFSGGGEPLLYKPLLVATPEFGGRTVLQWLAANNMWGALITHGGLLERFVENNASALDSLAFVRVSLDASNPAEHAVRHAAGTKEFDAILRGIRLLSACRGDAPVPAIGLSFVVDPGARVNCSPAALERLGALANSIGADFVQLKHVHTRDATEADRVMVALSRELPDAGVQWWVHRYSSVSAQSRCKVPTLAQVLRSDAKRSPCCHLQGRALASPDAYEVHGCTSPVCRYQSMDGVLSEIRSVGDAYLLALRRLRDSFERYGFHPYRLFPSAPDLARPAA